MNRWIVIARDFSPAVLDHVSSMKELPQKFVVGNRFLVGKGEEARFRLSDRWAKVAFDWYSDRSQDGMDVAADKFVTEFCTVAKHAESWEKAQKKVFGVVATGFRAFQRAVDKLQHETRRKAILAWLRDPELRKLPHFGLEELVALVAEMERTKAGAHKTEPNARPAQPASGPLAAHEQGAGAASAELEGGEEQDDIMGTDSAEDQDPVMSKAMALADIALTSVSVHQDSVAWTNEVQTAVFPSSRSIIYVECPTPKAHVFRLVEVCS